MRENRVKRAMREGAAGDGLLLDSKKLQGNSHSISDDIRETLSYIRDAEELTGR